MPRKKTVQPAPLKVIKAGDIEIEIRDAATRVIGRGEDKKFLTGETINQIVIGLVDDLLSKKQPRITRARDALDNNSSLATYLALGGYEQDDRTLRRYAAAVRKEFTIYKNAQDQYLPPGSPLSIRNILRPPLHFG